MTAEAAEGNARQAYLESLYICDGRHYPKHPAHGTYTGLYQERVEFLIQQDRELHAEATLLAATDVD